MKHPEPEVLVEYLYDELPPDRQADVARHLHECPGCQDQLAAWNRSRQALSTWQLDETEPRPHRMPWRRVGWAAAAAVLLALGFSLARLTAPAGLDLESIRETLSAELRQQLQAELGRFETAQARRHELFQESVTRILGRLEAQRLLDYATLRQDVETVAVLAQDELENTRRNLVRLANFESPVPNP